MTVTISRLDFCAAVCYLSESYLYLAAVEIHSKKKNSRNKKTKKRMSKNTKKIQEELKEYWRKQAELMEFWVSKKEE